MATSMILQEAWRTAVNMASKVVEERRLLIDITNWNIRLGDGSTVGGHVILNSANFGGAISVSPTGATTLQANLGDLLNVSGTPTNGQPLVWNATAGKWQPTTLTFTTALSALTDVALTGLASGNYLKYNGTSWVNSVLPAATNTVAGIVQLSAVAPLNPANIADPGTSTTAAHSDHAHKYQSEFILLNCSDESTPLTVGTKLTFRLPYALTLSSVKANLTIPQASGILFTVDIKQNGTSILSTLLTFDDGDKTTTSASTQAVISTTSLTNDAEIVIAITQIGDGTAAGLKVTLLGRQ
jgi:hypothetical protein